MTTTQTTNTPRKPAAKRAAPKPKAKAKPKAAPKLSWAKRNPELVASIPGRIATGQHPKEAAAEWGISLEVAWAAFKRAGWVASGKGGKRFEFASAADRRKAEAAVKVLASFGATPTAVMRALEREAAATS
jgi:hypothetical protein